ncbi:DUF1127 domain-containing protein [Roseovarius sp. MMSF_3350]|uniref:DUF1127 domain-containing protein n=1 Tax=unclassified Roseovarius TaxID=2614913 RepID=UPI00273DFC24|nr:DUF1127 domain-containing protein [Roseovarius sp. MMSF_3350]
MPTLSHRRHGPFRASPRPSLLDALELYRQRRALARLDDHALDDIGLTRAEADAEARRPIWDIFRR